MIISKSLFTLSINFCFNFSTSRFIGTVCIRIKVDSLALKKNYYLKLLKVINYLMEKLLMIL